MQELIKVAASSRTTSVAGAIAGIMREYGYAEVQAIGMAAVYQAIKALAIAHGYLEQEGIYLSTVPTFRDVAIDGKEITAVRLQVFKRPEDVVVPAEADLT